MNSEIARVKLTENSYGGSVIRKLREAYEEEAT